MLTTKNVAKEKRTKNWLRLRIWSHEPTRRRRVRRNDDRDFVSYYKDRHRVRCEYAHAYLFFDVDTAGCWAGATCVFVKKALMMGNYIHEYSDLAFSARWRKLISGGVGMN